jgi:hypothetical protein
MNELKNDLKTVLNIQLSISDKSIISDTVKSILDKIKLNDKIKNGIESETILFNRTNWNDKIDYTINIKLIFDYNFIDISYVNFLYNELSNYNISIINSFVSNMNNTGIEYNC